MMPPSTHIVRKLPIHVSFDTKLFNLIGVARNDSVVELALF